MVERVACTNMMIQKTCWPWTKCPVDASGIIFFFGTVMIKIVNAWISGEKEVDGRLQ
jgi:hypothetical protein